VHPLYRTKEFANIFGKNPFIIDNYLKEAVGSRVLKHIVPIGYRPNGTEINIELPLKRSKVMSVVAPRGCLPIDSLIMTPNGLTELKNLNLIDKIFSFDFSARKIREDIAMKIDAGRKKLYRIITETNKELICSPDHKWFVFDNKKIVERKTKNLQIGNKLVIL